MSETARTSTPTTLGLTASEVEERRRDGRANELPPRTGKSVGQIVKQNVFTRINAILFVLFVMVLSTGSLINGMFGLLIIVNSGIGIIQELRAKRTLESLTIVGEEHPRVWRDGELVEVTQEDLVLDDVVRVGAGNQIVVDGVVTTSDYLSVDESNLTGESDAVRKAPGDPIMSGSFVVSGTGDYTVTKVGAESYAAKLAEEASRFSLAHSELQAGINKILKYITWVLVPVGLLTIWSAVRGGATDWQAVVLEITGALVPMVPEGLVLITSTAFALGVIRLGQRKCLVQELPAIEGLARVDVVCADKTGTLTENTLEFSEIIMVEGCPETAAECEEILAQLIATDPDPNATAAAIAQRFPLTSKPWTQGARQPFTSAKKWSGTTFLNDDGTASSWLMGAPDVLAGDHPAGQKAEEIGAQGLRVLMLAHSPHPVDAADAPVDVRPVALLIFDQKLRPDAQDTLEYFADQGVEVKVISGDNAASVGAVTRRLGVDAGQAVDARHIDTDSFADTIENNRVFGRVRPDQKQAMVTALQERGHTVAMTGDGVNDVLALKDADIGVAMGSGAAATRAVAKIVLLDNRFATLPYVVAEGRRVIGNIERVANLFLTKTIYSAMLAILVIIAAVPFPFMPIHVTITGWFTIGIPAFLLALPPNNNRARPDFVPRVLRFAVPAGLIVGTSAFLTYMIVSGWDVPEQHTQESTAALLALIIPSSWAVCTIARPLSPWKLLLVALPLVGYGVIFNWSFTQQLFYLDSSNTAMMIQATAIGLVAAACIEALWWMLRRKAQPQIPLWKPEPFFDRD
ncbi:HAD-IC family P-type ATPase [Trueperella bialowiezensis]|uniref:Calcium-transporting ATPase lmo0841 n=1 Tax=Trueperella bialowiezensis TaxID=312285 RepID=A0A448PE30_9ACTO|nr:HAD-IC family P-type ATPase [Trueperella bialowiezensis]VEI13182.1 Calcium-transporting ATPase lmo0841 [Trueperella bialowiezensis]